MKTARWGSAAILLLGLAVLGADGRPNKEGFGSPAYRPLVRFRHKVLTRLLSSFAVRNKRTHVLLFFAKYKTNYSGTPPTPPPVVVVFLPILKKNTLDESFPPPPPRCQGTVFSKTASDYCEPQLSKDENELWRKWGFFVFLHGTKAEKFKVKDVTGILLIEGRPPPRAALLIHLPLLRLKEVFCPLSYKRPLVFVLADLAPKLQSNQVGSIKTRLWKKKAPDCFGRRGLEWSKVFCQEASVGLWPSTTYFPCAPSASLFPCKRISSLSNQR